MHIDGIKKSSVEEFGSGQGETEALPVCISGDASYECRRGITIKADCLVAGQMIFVGGPSVTPETGLLLRGRESQFLPVDETGKVYVIGSVEGLRFSWSKF